MSVIYLLVCFVMRCIVPRKGYQYCTFYAPFTVNPDSKFRIECRIFRQRMNLDSPSTVYAMEFFGQSRRYTKVLQKGDLNGIIMKNMLYGGRYMKYIVLSFDDGRKDFYTRALPILKKYGLSATLNIVPDYVGHNGMDIFLSGNGECVTWDEIEDCIQNGIEIANHSADHSNSVEQILRGSADISDRLGFTTAIGFASPNCEVCKKNFERYRDMLVSKQVKYIRSGNQLKRDGYGYALLWMLYRYTKSNILFNIYNRRNIVAMDSAPEIFPSITCNRTNTIGQVIHFVKKMPDNTAAIFMLHSILDDTDPSFGKDKWFNTCREFDQLCAFLAENQQVQVVTNDQLCDMLM